MKISILGAGSWGASLAYLLSFNKNLSISIWDHKPAKLAQIKESGVFPHPRELVKYSNDKYTLIEDFEKAFIEADVVVCAIPSEAIKDIIKKIKKIKKLDSSDLPVILSATKGLDTDTKQLMSQIWLEAYPNIKYVALSGPNLSAEAATNKPMKTILAANNNEAAVLIAGLFAYSENFKVKIINDLIGLELVGALKNVIALAAGAWDGFELGTSGKGCLLTKSIEEIKDLVIAYGGELETVLTVGGIGDLIITSSSELSRNYRTGLFLAQGKTMPEIKDLLRGQVSEGVYTADLLCKLCKEKNLEFPTAELVKGMVQADMQSKDTRDQFMSKFIKLI